MHDLERLKRLAEANDVDAIAMLAVYVKRSNDPDLKTYLIGLISANISKRGHEINRLHEIEQMVLKNPKKDKVDQAILDSFLKKISLQQTDRTIIPHYYSNSDKTELLSPTTFHIDPTTLWVEPEPEFFDSSFERRFKDGEEEGE